MPKSFEKGFSALKDLVVGTGENEVPQQPAVEVPSAQARPQTEGGVDDAAVQAAMASVTEEPGELPPSQTGPVASEHDISPASKEAETQGVPNSIDLSARLREGQEVSLGGGEKNPEAEHLASFRGGGMPTKPGLADRLVSGSSVVSENLAEIHDKAMSSGGAKVIHESIDAASQDTAQATEQGALSMLRETTLEALDELIEDAQASATLEGSAKERPRIPTADEVIGAYDDLTEEQSKKAGALVVDALHTDKRNPQGFLASALQSNRKLFTQMSDDEFHAFKQALINTIPRQKFRNDERGRPQKVELDENPLSSAQSTGGQKGISVKADSIKSLAGDSPEEPAQRVPQKQKKPVLGKIRRTSSTEDFLKKAEDFPAGNDSDAFEARQELKKRDASVVRAQTPTSLDAVLPGAKEGGETEIVEQTPEDLLATQIQAVTNATSPEERGAAVAQLPESIRNALGV